MYRHSVFILLLLGVSNSQLISSINLEKRVSYKECNQNATERQDCGYPGITEVQCNIRECCWSSTESSTPCYHSIPTISRQCVVESQQKIQCGSSDIRKEQCLAKECCWQPSHDGPWCYERQLPPIYTGQCGQTAVTPMTRNWRVIGGEEAIPNSWPWMVSLQRGGYHVCGGSILNDRWILSAAHCASAFEVSSSDSLAVLGAHNIYEEESTTTSIMMEYIIPHEDFDMYDIPGVGFTVQNDLLLIRLTESIEFNDFISPVCVASLQPVGGKSCYSMGWGLDELYLDDYEYEWSVPETLQQFMSPVVDKQLCNSTDYYAGRIHPSSMCAGWEEGGRGNCFGDSGGPLVCMEDGVWEQVGVVSWGEPCALARYPTVYGDVAPYYEWIQEQLSMFD